jgi:hypothetical protein
MGPLGRLQRRIRIIYNSCKTLGRAPSSRVDKNIDNSFEELKEKNSLYEDLSRLVDMGFVDNPTYKFDTS